MMLAADEHFADGIFDIIAQGIMKIYSYSSNRSVGVLYTQDSRLRNPRGVIRYRDIIEAERSAKACTTDILVSTMHLSMSIPII